MGYNKRNWSSQTPISVENLEAMDDAIFENADSVERIKKTVSTDYVKKSSTIAGIDLQDNITAKELQNKMGVYPTIIYTGPPNITTQGESGQFLIDVFGKQIWLCRGTVDNEETGQTEYIWRDINTGGEITDEQIAIAINEYLTKHPIEGQGADGKSAYQIALDNGFEGTETEWLESLQGKDGAQGEKGEKGDTGAAGAKGADGHTPVKGIDYFTQSDKEEIVDSLIDATGILQEISYNEVTNNLNDAVYEYGYLNADGSNHDTFNPISASYRTKNYLPVEGGRVLCWNRNPAANSRYINLVQYNANKECIVERAEQQCESNKWTNNGVTLNENTKYVRFTIYSTVEDLSLVEINLFYYENRAEMWDSTGDTFNYVPHLISEYIGNYVPLSKVQSPLTGKKIVYDGDSICYGAGYRGGYAEIIAEKIGGKYENYAQGGARLTTKPSDKTYHSVVDNLENLPTDGDLYCFEGGINDYWTPKQLGTFSKTDFTGALDTNTICGALETIFRYALNTFVGKPVCFVITHKIQSTAYIENTNGDTFEDYRNAMVGICEKYSIPYYDAFSKSGLNGWNSIQSDAFLTGSSNGTADGTHPNEEGYKRYYVPQLIAMFESIMPDTE